MNITKLRKNDIIIAHVGLGTMPTSRAKSYMNEIKVGLRKKFGNKIILFGTTEQVSVKLEIIRPT